MIEAKQSAVDPFSEIEKLMSWEAFETSVAEALKLARSEEFDLLVEVDGWTSFTAQFTHLRNGEVVSDRALLLRTA